MRINPTKTINELITALSYIIDTEGNKHIYHSWRVSILSARIAKGLVGPQKLRNIFYASLLHDVGGVEFSHHIIHYLKRNDRASRNLLLPHPIIGAQLISNIPQMNSVAKLILDHHEWMNGMGYPRARTEKYIPFGSQVIRISDSIDILLQTEHFSKLKRLKDRMSSNINREYSQGLFKRAIDKLKKDKFFYTIREQNNIPIIFKETKDQIGSIPIPSRIDAIGKTLEIFAQIIDMKHPYTSGHSLRVARYAMACALTMHLAHDDVTRIRWAGLIHDIGKINVARRILDKPTSLTPKEFREVKKHAIMSRDIMNMIPTLKELTPIVAGHHEYFDGSGYPLGLKGYQIPLEARILVICDAFDAMISNRPYRNPLSPEDACHEIEKFSGQQFDPDVVKEVLPLFRNLGL
jgi:putative nucleotidyltransferase with HDIG domain